MDDETNSKLLDRIVDCDANEQAELDVSKLDLESLPVEIMQVPQIRVLLAFKNRISTIPTMSTFKNMQKLDLSRNCLVTINEYRLSGLHSLKILDLSRNSLEALPEDIGKLPILETLLIHRNKLTKFPNSIGEMKTLSHLDVSYNNFTTIGDKLDGLPLLSTLNLKFNDNLDKASMSEKCQRLHSMHNLLTSKAERRALVKRCLGVDHEVRMKFHNQRIVEPMEAAEMELVREMEEASNA